MYFYLATRYADKIRMQTVARVLECMGHHVCSSWIFEPYSPDVQVSDVDPGELNEIASRDMVEIAACDVLVQFAEEPNMRGGAIVEYGIAIGLRQAGYDIQTALVGKRRNIFDHWDGIEFFETERDFLEWAKTLSPQKPKQDKIG